MTATFGAPVITHTYLNGVLVANQSDFNFTDIALPANGNYVVMMSFVTAQAANSMVKADAQLYVSYV